MHTKIDRGSTDLDTHAHTFKHAHVDRDTLVSNKKTHITANVHTRIYTDAHMST